MRIFRYLRIWIRKISLLIKKGEYKKVVNKDSKERIIVSLTSYGPRLRGLHYVLRSMLLQTLMPEKIIVYLDERDRDNVPDSLKNMEEYGIKIRFTEEEIKPHKKYYHAMQEYPDDIIITIDDDMMYSKNMVQNLYNAYKRFPDCVICSRGHEMKFDEEGHILPYLEWGWEITDSMNPSYMYFAAGGAGTLYPPHIMDDRLFNIDLIKEKCLNADDVYLKWIEALCGRKVVLAEGNTYKESQDMYVLDRGLNTDNNGPLRMNDVFIHNLIEYQNTTTDSRYRVIDQKGAYIQ